MAPHREHPAPDPHAPAVVIGDALIDEVVEPGERGALASTSRVGGSALGVATAAALLGIECVLITSIGDDDDGARIREHLDAHGIRLLPTVGVHGTGRAVTRHEQAGVGPRFNEASQLRRIKFDDAQLAAIGAAPYVAVSGFAFDDKKQQRRLLEAVRQPQNRLIIDPNPREGLIHDADAFRDNFERHASSCLLVHLGDRDAGLVFDSPLDEVTSDLLDLGARHVLATEGSNGARWVNRAGVDVTQPITWLPGEIVDTTGGGDAVFAVALASLVRNGPPNDAAAARAVLEQAMALAAATIRKRGAALVEPDEVPAAARG